MLHYVFVPVPGIKVIPYFLNLDKDYAYLPVTLLLPLHCFSWKKDCWLFQLNEATTTKYLAKLDMAVFGFKSLLFKTQAIPHIIEWHEKARKDLGEEDDRFNLLFRLLSALKELCVILGPGDAQESDSLTSQNHFDMGLLLHQILELHNRVFPSEKLPIISIGTVESSGHVTSEIWRGKRTEIGPQASRISEDGGNDGRGADLHADSSYNESHGGDYGVADID